MRPDTDATVKQIDSLLEQLSAADPASRAMAEELIRTLMQLYGAGLERIVEVLREASATDMAARLADDKLVGSLLLLHGLHPVDAETRVREGLPGWSAAWSLITCCWNRFRRAWHGSVSSATVTAPRPLLSPKTSNGW